MFISYCAEWSRIILFSLWSSASLSTANFLLLICTCVFFSFSFCLSLGLKHLKVAVKRKFNFYNVTFFSVKLNIWASIVVLSGLTDHLKSVRGLGNTERYRSVEDRFPPPTPPLPAGRSGGGGRGRNDSFTESQTRRPAAMTHEQTVNPH